METWDLIIVGGGPAGLTAGIYAGRSGLETLILEEKTPGGEASLAPWIENFPGFESISGLELAEKMTRQCRKSGAKIVEVERATSLDLKGREKHVKTDRATYSASAIIVATGTRNRPLNVPGEDKYRGKGVSYCALCDGPFFKDKKVIVVGGGNSAAMSACYLAGAAADVKLVHRRNQLRAAKASVETLRNRNVEILLDSEIKEIKGNSIVESAILKNNRTGEVREIRVDGVFVQIGELPNTAFVVEAGVLTDDKGYIITDNRQRTNVPGVFAAGDVTNGPVKQIGTAVGQAIVAATEAFGYIREPYYYEDQPS